MAALGGGMTHAAMGMRVWTPDVRPVAEVGGDYPPEMWAQLEAHFDTQGLRKRPGLPTPRAWQLFEVDGHRTEIFRTRYEDLVALNPQPNDIPLDVLASRGVHLQAHAPEPLDEWIPRLHAAGVPFILWEPWDPFLVPENFDMFARLAATVDAVSPNLEEGRLLTGAQDPREVLRRLLGTGVSMVALRMGAQGSLVADQGGTLLRVPAVPPVQLVDQTGAGNAFCGGFVVGMGETGSLAEAAKYAAVSASFALEQFGALYPLDGLREQAQARLEKISVEFERLG
jgi:sugar/nucleoside kinase (ribokinase family)